MEQDLTTLICLFHSKDRANDALQDLLKAGIPEANITLIGDGSTIATNGFSLQDLNVPDRDRGHLLDGIRAGGAVLTVSAISTMADKGDEIFKAHSAEKIDEAVIDDDMSGVDTLAGDTAVGTDTVLLVPDELTGSTYVYRVAPTATTTLADEDVDPRELGLDSRMAPAKTSTDL